MTWVIQSTDGPGAQGRSWVIRSAGDASQPPLYLGEDEDGRRAWWSRHSSLFPSRVYRFADEGEAVAHVLRHDVRFCVVVRFPE